MSVANFVMCIALALLMAVLLIACSSPTATQDASSGASAARASTAMPASNPLTPLLNTRNRAKAVQQDLKAHDDAERKALKDAQQQ